jgi:hypothetical protein
VFDAVVAVLAVLVVVFKSASALLLYIVSVHAVTVVKHA